MDIHELKKDYYKECTIFGLLGKGTMNLMKLVAFVGILGLVAFSILLVPIFNNQNYITVVLILLGIVIYFAIMLNLLILIGRLKIKKITGKMPEKHKITNASILKTIKINYKNLLIRYNLLNKKPKNTESKYNKELLEYTIVNLTDYAEKTKYDFITDKAVMGALLVVPYAKVIDHIYDLSKGNLSHFFIATVFVITIIYLIYLASKKYMAIITSDIINSNSNKYLDLANKLEALKYGVEES